MPSVFSLDLSKTNVSGAVAAAIMAASIAIAAMGVLTYVRKAEPLKTWLVPYEPTAQYGGIFLYSNVIWGILWVALFFALRQRQNAGTLKTWLLFFLISLAIGTGFAEASLNWSQLPSVMQLGGKESQASTGENAPAHKIVKILEASSIQGNPSYEPDTATVSRGDLVTWVNADAAPHTVTSGVGADDPKSGKIFDSGPLGQDQEFRLNTGNLDAGSHDYYCIIHPFMKGRVAVQ